MKACNEFDKWVTDGYWAAVDTAGKAHGGKFATVLSCNNFIDKTLDANGYTELKAVWHYNKDVNIEEVDPR